MAEEAEQGQYLSELGTSVRRLLETAPPTFADRAALVRSMRSVIAREIATNLAPILNAEAGNLPQESLAEKRRLASWINQQLRQIGLAIKTPDGLPGILIADAWRHEEEGSRLRIEVRDEHGHKRRSTSYARLPKLELMEDVSLNESRARGR